MAVAEARIDPQRDRPARGAGGELVDHVGRAAVDVDVLGDAEIEGVGVEDVGGVDDRRRVALGDVAGGQGAANLAAADRVDQRPAAAEEIENRQIRARLLRVANDVEGGQIGQPPKHDGRVVDERRRAEPPRQLGCPDAANLTPHVAAHQRIPKAGSKLGTVPS